MRAAAIVLLSFLGTQAAAVTPCVLDAPRMQLVANSSERIFTNDLDGDGHVDLGVAGRLWYGHGDGTLEPAINGNLSYVRIEEFTGDGMLDVVRRDGDALALLVNLGARRFAPPVSIPSFSAAGDFTGDGYADLLVPAGNERYRMLINDGHGVFAAAPAGDTILRAVSSLTTSDVNADGAVDLIAHTEGFLRILLSDRQGGFIASSRLNNWYETQPLVADVNQDGQADVITILSSNESDSAVIYYGPSFTSKAILQSSVPRAARSAVATGDFDGDGDIDVAVCGFKVEIFLNTGNAHFSSVIAIDARLASIGAADFNEDGALDLALPSAGIILGNGDGTFRLPRRFGQIDSIQIAGIADLNGDGIDEILIGGVQAGGTEPRWPLQVAWMTPSGDYQSDTLGKTPREAMVAAGDVLAQAGKEVVQADGSALRIFSFAGPGQWSEPATYDLGMPILALALANLTADSRLEIAVVVRDTAGQPSLRIFTGTGVLQSITLLGPSEYFRIGVFDADGDRRMDVVIGATGTEFPDFHGHPVLFNGYLSLFRGGGHATFFPEQRITDRDHVLRMTAVGDINGDGNGDIIVHSYTEAVRTFFGNGDGTFTVRPEPAGFDYFFAGDLNRDGISDFLVLYGVLLKVLLGSPGGFIDSGLYFAECNGYPGAFVRRSPNASPAIVCTSPPYVTVIATRCQQPGPRRHAVRH